MRRAASSVVWWMTLLASAVLAFPQAAFKPSQEIERAIAAAEQKGLPDQSIAELSSLIDRAVALRDKNLATLGRLALSNYYWELGRRVEGFSALQDALPDSRNTDLEPQVQSMYYNYTASMALDKDQYFAVADLVAQAETWIPKISEENPRNAALSKALYVRVQLYIRFLQEWGARLERVSAVQIDPRLQVLVAALLKQVSPDTIAVNAHARSEDLPPKWLNWLDERRPWIKSLARVALAISDKEMDLDQRSAPQAGRELNLAVDSDQRAELLAMIDRVDEAVVLKKKALEVFDRLNLFRSAIVTMDGLCRIYEQHAMSGSTAELLRLSDEMVFRLEREASGLVGETMPSFLQEYRQIYDRHYRLLWGQYETMVRLKRERADWALGSLLVHADRFNFRPVRRDMTLYRELGELIGNQSEGRERLEREKSTMLNRQRECVLLDASAKTPAELKAARESDGSPCRLVGGDKMRLVTAFQDLARVALTSREQWVPPPNIERARRGMTTADAIIMYFNRPEKQSDVPSQRLAAVIPSVGPIRVVPLPQMPDDALIEIVQECRQDIALGSPGVDRLLRALSDAFWRPLGNLPENLTIILTPELLGVPFEALPTSAGDPVVAEHRIRYAFGLSTGIGAQFRREEIRDAMLVGASKFFTRDLRSLPGSREEVESLKSFLGKRGIRVYPDNVLPEQGKPLFAEKKTFSFIHISTHSDLDISQPVAPMVDILAFPHDELFGYELALSPVRAHLVVFSACELFRPRENQLYPVSGITTAALARIAPQAVSTLWPVDQRGSNTFMLRFYDALLEEGEPSAALAVTKRAFLRTERLRNWLTASSTSVPSETQLAEYRKPYYWAPFILVVGLSDEKDLSSQ